MVCVVVFLPKMHNLNLFKRKYQTYQNRETFYKITDRYTHQKCQGHERQGKNKELSQTGRN